MISNLHYPDFRDICLRLKYYPEYFTVDFFCSNLKDRDNFIYFIKEITEINNISCNNHQIINNKITFNFYLPNYVNECNFCGARANIALVSDSYSCKTLREIILPTINSSPCQQIFIYDQKIWDSNYGFKEEHKRYKEVYK